MKEPRSFLVLSDVGKPEPILGVEVQNSLAYSDCRDLILRTKRGGAVLKLNGKDWLGLLVGLAQHAGMRLIDAEALATGGSLQ